MLLEVWGSDVQKIAITVVRQLLKAGCSRFRCSWLEMWSLHLGTMLFTEMPAKTIPAVLASCIFGMLLDLSTLHTLLPQPGVVIFSMQPLRC